MREGAGNLEWIEIGLREALSKDARGLLSALLNDPQLKVKEDTSRPEEKCYRQRSKVVETLFGEVELKRNYYHNPRSDDKGRFPLDDALGLIDGYSPGLARLMCRAGAQSPCEMAGADLKAYGGIEIEGRQIQRMIDQIGPDLRAWVDTQPEPEKPPPLPKMYASYDATGVPMRADELQGRPGKQEDGSSKTREAKLGCVFTQHQVDEEGYPLRDADSTSYIASFESSDEFGSQMRQEAIRRGMAYATQMIVIGDGAPWIWETARVNFPKAIEILDFYHAMEHLNSLSAALYGEKTSKALLKSQQWKTLIKNDQLSAVIKEAQKKLPHHGSKRKEAQKQIAYFQKNTSRMTYATFRKKGLFIGSGVVEAGCKTVIGKRLKQSGMFWSIPGAQNVLSIRCSLYGHRFDSYWNQRNPSQHAGLALAN